MDDELNTLAERNAVLQDCAEAIRVLADGPCVVSGDAQLTLQNIANDLDALRQAAERIAELEDLVRQVTVANDAPFLKDWRTRARKVLEGK